MKGIVLAGGTGSRLWPITRSVSKQLLPVYDKPMIYYPISTLMLAGIREILIITTPQDQLAFQNLLGDGSDFGISIRYAVQQKPEGLAQAFIVGREFLNGDSCLMILGDNLFHGAGLGNQLKQTLPANGAHIFVCEVSNPNQYGILEVNSQGNPLSVEEKPSQPKSNLAITGLYFFDELVTSIAELVEFSPRGELEITSIISKYLEMDRLDYTKLSRGSVWLDTGTVEAIMEASTYVRVLEKRTGLNIGSLEEIALKENLITPQKLKSYLLKFGDSPYYEYLRKLLIET